MIGARFPGFLQDIIARIGQVTCPARSGRVSGGGQRVLRVVIQFVPMDWRVERGGEMTAVLVEKFAKSVVRSCSHPG